MMSDDETANDTGEYADEAVQRLIQPLRDALAQYDGTAFDRLREPFPDEAIGKLPRAGTQLDYVGHAAVTSRLLEVDPTWTWEPYAIDEDGCPKVRYEGDNAVLWINLTVCGITRPGVGIVAARAAELEKQLISDALRNAAMRFGVALDLWSKEALGAEPEARLDKTPDKATQNDAAAEALGYSSYSAMRELVEAFYADAKAAFQSEQIDAFQRQELLDDFGPASPKGKEGGGWLSRDYLNEARERLTGMLPKAVTEPAAEPAADAPAPDDDQDATPRPGAKGYDAWSGEELRAECRERGLPVSGNKSTLVERLRMTHPAGTPEADQPPF